MTLARNDRLVHHCRVAVRGGTPARRIVTSLEDALRLTSLPGESTGRVYYFRRVRVSGAPGDRRGMEEAVGAVLQAEAARAVHGSLPGARYANAVYFHNEEDACRSLLSVSGNPSRGDAWFWTAVSGSPAETSGDTRVADALERLSRSPASWFAVASVVFHSPDRLAAALDAVPQSRARQWLRQMQIESSWQVAASPAACTGSVLLSLRRAAATFPADDPRILLAASLAVILLHPAEMESGRPVSRAMATLRALSAPVASPAPAQRDDENDTDGLSSLQVSSLGPAVEQRPRTAPAAASRSLHGDRTGAGGLYFLLNILSQLRLSARRRNPVFVARFLLLAAFHAGADAGDPGLLCLQQIDMLHPAAPGCAPVLARLLRRAQRWCWRHARMGLDEVVRRRGYVSLSSTHLDIALPLDAADVRIRRIGLDLDPGWLPWFGRVVHFHYKDRGELA